jgi:hypothetical protein
VHPHARFVANVATVATVDAATSDLQALGLSAGVLLPFASLRTGNYAWAGVASSAALTTLSKSCNVKGFWSTGSFLNLSGSPAQP